MNKILKHLKKNWIRHGFETLAVLLGVLAAFTLNSWYEGRKDRLLEREYSRNINQEFKMNRVQFEERLETFRGISESCFELGSKFPITVSTWDSTKLILLQGVWGGATFDPSQSSVNSLIQVSSVDIIRDASLRNLLLSWSSTLEDWKEEEVWMQDALDELGTWMTKNTDGFDDHKLMNPDLLFELQNLIQARCYWQDFIINNVETQNLINHMDSIIILTEPYVE